MRYELRNIFEYFELNFLNFCFSKSINESTYMNLDTQSIYLVRERVK